MNNPKVIDNIENLKKIFKERNKEYGNTYKTFGEKAMIFMDEHNYGIGNSPRTKEDWCRLFCLVHMIDKLSRYCSKYVVGGHADSLDDLAIYAMMLKELDEN